VCGEAYDGVKATEEAQRLKPDIVVLKKFGTEKSTIKSRQWVTIMEVRDSIDDFRQNSIGYSRSRHDRWNLLLFRSFSHNRGRGLVFVEHSYL